MTFPVLVDEEGQSTAVFGFKAVPNGVLIDTDGTIRWTKYGGFSVDTPEDSDTVRRFFAGEKIQPSTAPETPYSLGPTEQELVATKLRLGQVLTELGRSEEAVAAWREALRLDPENLTIRKQIWAAEHPERFHPAIDWDWQKTQLKAEREREIAEGICGPDGCPVPWSSPTNGAA